MVNADQAKRRIGDNRDDEANVAHKAEVLFARLGDWGLGRLMELARVEMKKRLADAEKRIAEMKQHFGDVDIQSPKLKPTRKNQQTTRRRRLPTKAGASGSKIESRGKLKSTIIDILSQGKKSRSDIESEVTMRGLPVKSVGTTLNRLKKNKVIKHDASTKMYSLSEDQREHLASGVDDN